MMMMMMTKKTYHISGYVKNRENKAVPGLRVTGTHQSFFPFHLNHAKPAPLSRFIRHGVFNLFAAAENGLCRRP